VIVYFWQFITKIREVAHIFGYFSLRLMLYIHLEKNGLGYIWWDFFTNSSGHPEGERIKRERSRR
jgi:hypothetical protein